jgi:DNA-binding response OmpR family regulator
VQAKALAKESSDGGSLREASAHLPLVLMSEKGSSTDDVWRGIELGAADVLEKPLSSLKLRNIWQHVVRRVRLALPAQQRSSVHACTPLGMGGACCRACMHASQQC